MQRVGKKQSDSTCFTSCSLWSHIAARHRIKRDIFACCSLFSSSGLRCERKGCIKTQTKDFALVGMRCLTERAEEGEVFERENEFQTHRSHWRISYLLHRRSWTTVGCRSCYYFCIYKDMGWVYHWCHFNSITAHLKLFVWIDNYVHSLTRKMFRSPPKITAREEFDCAIHLPSQKFTFCFIFRGSKKKEWVGFHKTILLLQITVLCELRSQADSDFIEQLQAN